MTGSISRIVTHLKHMEPIATITSHYNNSAASVVEVYVGFTRREPDLTGMFALESQP